jgi:hypothetical protein
LLGLEEATVLALEPVSFDLALALDWEVDTETVLAFSLLYFCFSFLFQIPV